MDGLTKLIYRQFELAQRVQDLQTQLKNVMKEYNEISRQISELQERANGCD